MLGIDVGHSGEDAPDRVWGLQLVGTGSRKRNVAQKG